MQLYRFIGKKEACKRLSSRNGKPTTHSDLNGGQVCMRFHLRSVRTMSRYGLTLPSPLYSSRRSQVVKRCLDDRPVTLCAPLEAFFTGPQFLYLRKAGCPIGEITVINHIKQVSLPLNKSSGKLERIVTVRTAEKWVK
jgi:hypothetical protein